MPSKQTLRIVAGFSFYRFQYVDRAMRILFIRRVRFIVKLPSRDELVPVKGFIPINAYTKRSMCPLNLV